MKREIFLLEHNGEILHRIGSFLERKDATAATKDAGVLFFLQPSSFLKHFGKPGEYERAMAEFKPPTVVRFVEETE